MTTGGSISRCLAVLCTMVAVSMTACSSPAPTQDGPTGDASATTAESKVPTREAMPAGGFELTTESGAKINFTLPTPPTDPAVAEVEAFRVEVGGPPVSYLVADVDNRQGTEMVNMYMVAAFNEEGRQYTFSSVTGAIDAWEPTFTSDYEYRLPDGTLLDEAVGESLSSKSSELANANIINVDPAERATVVLVSTDVDLPSEFTRVAVQPSGMGEDQEAKPAAG